MENYKLKSEIREFIIQKAREHPELGCRKLSGLIQEAFRVDISKSSVGTVLKSEGLNKAVGRRSVLIPAPETAIPNMGCWFLKAAELCLGGAQEYNDLSPVLRDVLSVLTGKEYSSEDEKWRLDYLEPAQPVSREIFNRLAALRTGVLAIKFILEDNSFFFLDAGCHSIWSTGSIPKYFSSGPQKTKEWLNEVMAGIKPIILQAPPGFDTPAPAFLDFLASFQSEKPDKAIKRFELYSVDNLLINTIQPQPQKKRYFILGLWPWQYKNRGREELSLLPSLRSLAMINNDNRKVLDIITNLEKEKHNDNEVIGYYLERWPNLETGYQDFLDKIGHFNQCSQIEWKQKNNVQFPESGSLTLSGISAYWRQELNLYCQEYFFPLSCRELDFLALKERFYNLRGRAGGGNSASAALKVVFELPEDFPHLQDLSYACQRVNEADIHLFDGRRLVFEAGAE